MKHDNGTVVLEFILLGHWYLLCYPRLLFTLLLIIYILSLMGNSLIIYIIQMDSRLHIPMYFFLCHLSLLEILFTSTTIPTMMIVSLGQRKRISVPGCLVQIFFLHFLGCTECCLLTVMAYDRYMAICRPLHYNMAMRKSICLQLATISWAGGFLDALVLTVVTSKLPFCGPNEVANFFCDIPPLLKLACVDTRANETTLSLAGSLLALIPFLFILASYFHIISAILRISSSQARWKVFSTCTSHLTVVSLFYGTVIFTYVIPSSSYSINQDRVGSLVCTVFTPILNPLIYSLRNHKVKEAVKKTLWRKVMTPSDLFMR
ncbi:olfactory receptor 10C1-like [Rhinatrema bivittatum]|uniref:olfactory receptor 10C1-like n=1 Tax=Rhinatrema bivittatum TaxID=194408 RepID=UPI00112C5070|nr:olfactory receptor 10C1-like [Rhinatrema bivittatum]